jgi:hypothetical protein
LVRPLRVRVVMVKVTSRAMVSGSRPAARSPVSRRRRAHAVRFVQHDELRPVGQGFQRLEGDGLRAVLDAPGEVGAAGGEPDPPVHGEEPAIGEIDDPGRERPGQLVGERVLPVVVAADGGGDPAAGRGADVRGDPQQRPGPVPGRAERVGERAVPGQLHGGAVHRGDLQALPQDGDAELGVGAGGVELEDLLHGVLAEQLAGLGERRPGRRFRAGLEPQAGQPERRREYAIVALAREKARDQDADHGHLRVQRAVIGMPGRGFPQRPGDHVIGQQVFQQPLPAQVRQPVRPQAGAGRHPGGQLVIGEGGIAT